MTPGWLKSCLLAEERVSGRSPDARRTPEGPLKGSWALKASSHAYGWAFWRDTRLAQPGGQLAYGGWLGDHPSTWWVSPLHLGNGFPASNRDGGLHEKNPGHADPIELDSGTSPEPWRLLWCPGFYLIYYGTASAHPGRGLVLQAGFASLRDDAWCLALSPHQLTEEIAHAFQSHIMMV